MAVITLQPVSDPDWPAREASAYADWWMHTDRIAGARDAPLGPALRLPTLLFTPVTTGSGMRFVASPQAPPGTGIGRRLPIWHQALPSGRPPGAQDGTLMVEPVAEFGDALQVVAPKPAAVAVVIDTAINPLHEQFRNGALGSRIRAHWLMESAHDGSARVPFGREIRMDQINAHLNAPEDVALRALGLVVFDRVMAPRGTAQTSAHGTQVMALAAGTDPQDASAQAQALRDVPILAVSLPSNRLLSPSGVFLDAFVDQALEWVSTRLADLYGADWPPVVLNLSYGLAAGPKDGTGYLETRIRSWLEQHPRIRMFLPAGNDGMAQGHAMLTMAEGQSVIGWMVPPSDRFSTHAEVWLSGDTAGAALVLTPPGMASLHLAAGGAAVTDLVVAGTGTIGRVYDLGRTHPDGRPGFLICLAPTRAMRPGVAQAPPGLWQIGVTGAGSLRADVHLQSERSLTPGSRTTAQGRLMALAPGGAAPRREGTLNAIAVGTGAQIIDGRDMATGRPALWTSQGDGGAAPPFAATDPHPADCSRARPGLIAPGYRSGSTAIVHGTSFSTALASRAELLNIAAPPSRSTADCARRRTLA